MKLAISNSNVHFFIAFLTIETDTKDTGKYSDNNRAYDSCDRVIQDINEAVDQQSESTDCEDGEEGC